MGELQNSAGDTRQVAVIDAQGKIYRQVYGMTFETPLLESGKDVVTANKALLAEHGQMARG